MGKKVTTFFTLIMVVVASLFSSGNVFAGTTGKISGKVVDADTGEPMIGVNIILQGTSLGAASDIEGYYFINNISPGTYSLKISSVGYESKVVTGVRVVIDKTTVVNIELKNSAVEVQTIVVRAKQEIVSLGTSGTTTNLASEDIQSKPATAMEEILAMQPGITIGHSAQNGTGISIRGGGVDETAFQMNGISLKDQTSNVAFMDLPQTAIKEIQVLTGGFSAEYGGVRSGVVNVITKEGSFTDYESSIDLKYTPPALKHFGPNAFDQNGRIWQVFAGNKAFEGTTSADVLEYNRTKGASGYPFEFRGWNSIARDLLQDGIANNDMTPQEALELWKYQHRPIEYGNIPDYCIDASLSGPVPLSIFGTKLSFLASVRLENLQFPYPLSRKGEHTQVYLFKLSTEVFSNFKLSIDNIYGVKKGSSIGYNEDIGVISGGFWGPVAATASGSRSSVEYAANEFSYQEMYNEGYTSLRDDYMYRLNVELKYIFDKSTFASLKYQYGRNWVSSGHTRERSGAGVYQIGNKWYDETPRGWSSALGSYDLTKTFYLEGGGERYNRSSNLFHSFQLEITSQINQNNEIKAGVGTTLSSIHTRSAVYWLPKYYPYEETPWVWQYWDEKPITGYFFAQDKLEFEGMVANIGLRADYLDPNTNCYDMETIYDSYYTPQRFSVGTVLDLWFKSKKTVPAKAKIKLQPRIGVSFPVSDVGKIYFNYGHFYQTPDYYRMYSPAVTGGGAPGFLVSNPDLDWPRTIQFEVGYEHSIAELFLIRAAGYYKNISGQFMLVTGIDWDETVRNQTWTNNQYGDIRGIEISFNKPYGDYFTFWSNFNYSVGTTGITSLDVIYENPIKAEEQKYYVDKIEPVPSISVSAGVTLSTPENFGPEIFGIDLFGDIALDIIYSYDDGGKTLFNPEAPTDQQHYLNCVDYTNTDLKLSKTFTIGKNKLMLYMDVFNVFDQKYLFMGGMTQSEYQKYRSSLRVPWGEGDKKGNDKWGDFPHDGKHENIDIGWRDWNQFLNPRQIDFGIRFQL